jgi:hypothetical protein
VRGARPRPVALAVLAVALGACGPYADVAQKLDVTARVAGDTWIARSPADDRELRVLLVAAPGTDGAAPFAFSDVLVNESRGTAVHELQGAWSEAGSAGLATLHVQHEYAMPDESGQTDIWKRVGTTRADDRYDVELTVARDAGRLTIAGDPSFAGTYVPLVEVLGNLGTWTPDDRAACAFQLANLGMLISEGRIIGFGGPAITQYDTAATYVGTIAGDLRISITFTRDYQHNTTTVAYAGFEEIGGVRVDGPMTTDADASGSGQMSGLMTFAIAPPGASGGPGDPITGTIDYGGGGNPVRIVDGTAIGGVYLVSIDGGGTAQLPPEAPPSPSVASCLALP